MLSRRTFLLGSTALAATSALPTAREAHPLVMLTRRVTRAEVAAMFPDPWHGRTMAEYADTRARMLAGQWVGYRITPNGVVGLTAEEVLA